VWYDICLLLTLINKRKTYKLSETQQSSCLLCLGNGDQRITIDLRTEKSDLHLKASQQCECYSVPVVELMCTNISGLVSDPKNNMYI